MKRFYHADLDDAGKLLLARGACIETSLYRKTLSPLGCSSQEEHVLKHGDSSIGFQQSPLLLARGACIETMVAPMPRYLLQLLLARGACIETILSV